MMINSMINLYGGNYLWGVSFVSLVKVYQLDIYIFRIHLKNHSKFQGLWKGEKNPVWPIPVRWETTWLKQLLDVSPSFFVLALPLLHDFGPHLISSINVGSENPPQPSINSIRWKPHNSNLWFTHSAIPNLRNCVWRCYPTRCGHRCTGLLLSICICLCRWATESWKTILWLEGMDLQYFEGMDIFAVTKSDRTIIA